METVLAVLLAMTVEVSETRPAGGSAKAHKPSGKSMVSKPINATGTRFPLLDETAVCQPMPATKKKAQAKASSPKKAPKGRCMPLRPTRPSPRQASKQRAYAPRKARVASATNPKSAAKRSGKKKGAKDLDAQKKKWVPERVFVRPSVSISGGR